METLGWLALSRGTLDRVAERRRDEDWVEELWTDPRARVLVVHEGKALVRIEGAPTLVLVATGRFAGPPATRLLLGVDDEGVAYFTVPGPLPVMEGTESAHLRRIGAMLDDRDSGLLTHAVALHNWHETHAHCPRCGERTRSVAAGHVRACPACGGEQFPRVDPAVIMLVHDGDRLLLARHPAWPERRVSILAGFVEPGESLEQAVAREVHEEVGLVVDDIRYLGSQPWPLPQSLMLGFFCRAEPGQEVRQAEDEITDARWYDRDELRAAADAKDILLPGKVSIARQLIERWYGGPLTGSWGL